MMHYILGMEVWTRKVCSRDPEEVQDDGLEGNGRMDSYMVLNTAEEKDVSTCYLGGSMFLLKTTI